MKTEMENAVPYSIRLENSRRVLFTFDLDETNNQCLRDEELLKRSMAAYILKHPNLERYEATYVGKWLLLAAVGTLPTHIVNQYL